MALANIPAWNTVKARELTKLLSKNRLKDPKKWRDVGIALHSIDKSLLDIWTECSNEKNKQKCKSTWESFPPHEYSMQSLCIWAEKDNQTKYIKYIQAAEGMLEEISESEENISEMLYILFKYDFIYKDNKWYTIKKGKTNPTLECKVVSTFLDDELTKKILQYIIYFYRLALTTDKENIKYSAIEKGKRMNNLLLNISKLPFRQKIMKRCRDLFLYKKITNI